MGRVRRTISYDSELDAFVQAQAKARHNDDISAFFTHAAETVRAIQMSPFADANEFRLKAIQMVEHYFPVIGKGHENLGLDLLIPTLGLAFECKVRYPETHDFGLVSAIVATLTRKDATRAWIVVPDTMLTMDINRFKTLATALPVADVSCYRLSEAEQQLIAAGQSQSAD